MKSRIDAIAEVVLELEDGAAKLNPPTELEKSADLQGFITEVNSLKQEFNDKINGLHESLEERYVDFIDTNAVMVKSDNDLVQRINAVEEVVLDLEDIQNTNNTSHVTPEMLGKLNGEFTGKIDGLTMQIVQGIASKIMDYLLVAPESNNAMFAFYALWRHYVGQTIMLIT